MISFLQELKRRKVIRVGSAYIAVGWGLTQVIAEFGGGLNLPEWFNNAFIVLVLAGLPLALLLAWAFEVTPDGVATTAGAAAGTSQPRLQFIDFALLGAMIVVVAIVAAGLFRDRPPRAAAPTTAEAAEDVVPSIAVLPFVDMSDTGDQGYFSDGLSEEIMNVLAQVDGLKVASRTSAFSFKGSDKGVPEIASVLGVAHVLEGSVRKSGDRLRITAQLIRAEDGFHLWSETYDRTLDDVFAIQDDVSQRILEELELLVGGGPAPVAAQRGDVTAFDLVLQAREVGSSYSTEGHERAIALYRRAIEIDSEYAPAYFGLATQLMLNSDASAGQGDRPVAEALEEAWPILERGRELAPDDPKGWTQLALYHQFNGEPDAAEAAYKRAAEIQPNIGLNNYAVLLLEQRRMREAIKVLESELELDPTSGAVRNNLVSLYVVAGQMDDARKVAEESRRALPDSKGLFSATAIEAQYEVAVGNWANGIKLYEALLEETPGVQPTMLALGWEYLNLRAYDEASLVGLPTLMAAAMAFAGAPEFPLKQLTGMIDSGVENPVIYFGAVYFAAIAGDWGLIADKIVPAFPTQGDIRNCEQRWFPIDIVMIAYRNLERDIAADELMKCWDVIVRRWDENDFEGTPQKLNIGMWHWFRGEPDAAYAALEDAVARHVSDPALDRRMAMAGMLDDPRGRAILERHFEHVNRERARLDLEPVEVPIAP